MAVEPHVGQPVTQRRDESVPKVGDTERFDFTPRRKHLHRFAEANDTGDIFRTGALFPLLLPAMQIGQELRPFADIQRADSLGAVDFMRGKRHQIHAEVSDIEWCLSQRLHGICVKVCAKFLDNLRNLPNWLNGTDFVVRVHHRHQRRTLRYRCRDRIRINDTVRADGHIGHGKAEHILREPRAVQNGMMLDGGGDEMIAPITVRQKHAQNRRIVRLGAAGREVNLRRMAPDSIRRRITRPVNRGARLLSPGMNGRGIAERVRPVAQKRQHCLADGRVYGCGGSIIEIDAWRHNGGLSPRPPRLKERGRQGEPVPLMVLQSVTLLQKGRYSWHTPSPLGEGEGGRGPITPCSAFRRRYR